MSFENFNMVSAILIEELFPELAGTVLKSVSDYLHFRLLDFENA